MSKSLVEIGAKTNNETTYPKRNDYGGSLSPGTSNNQLTNNLSQKEMELIRKYAQISAKSVSAVVKMSTVTDEYPMDETNEERISHRTSMFNRFSNTNQLKKREGNQVMHGRLFGSRGKRDERSMNNESFCNQQSADGGESAGMATSAVNKFGFMSTRINDNVSSKLSLFKKSVSD